MEMTSSLVVRALALAGALALTGPAQPAAAKKAKKLDPTVTLVKEFRGPVRPGSTLTEDAKCPPGNEVIGGSYSIGGSSFFAHASDATPVPDKRLFRVSVTNPRVNPFAGIPAANATFTVTAECTQSGRPIVVDGRFEPAERHKPGSRQDTVTVRNGGEESAENNSVTAAQATCPKGTSVFGGGYLTGGSPWAHVTVSAVASQDNLFDAVLVHPPFDPPLGIFRQKASFRPAAMCAKRGEPIVINGGEGSRRSASTAKKRRSKGTVKVVIEDLNGIENGEVESVDATCPSGYSVFGGSVLVNDEGALAIPTEAVVLSKLNAYRATVANPPKNPNAGIPKTTAGVRIGALCAKDGRPIVVDGHF